MSQNERGGKYYRTEKGVRAIHKNVVYATTRTIEEFDKAYSELTDRHYNSSTHERRRSSKLTFSKKIVARFDKIRKIFETLTVDLANSHDLSIESFAELKSTAYKKARATKNMYKYEVIEVEGKNELYFTLTNIYDDVVYIDEVWVYQTRNGKFKLSISKSMMLPFTRDIISQHTWTGGWFTKKKFKLYKNQILEGLDKMLVKE